MSSGGGGMESEAQRAGGEPRISVAMATYNGARFLPEQLDSLARQTSLPYELVVTDDESSDETVSLLEAFAATAPFPVRVHPNPVRLGYAENFLRACSLCTGELIALCDQDDVWLEAKLATCAGYFADPDVTMVIHAAEVWDGQTRTGRFHPDYRETKILPQATANFFTLVPGFAMVFRKSILSLIDNTDRPGDIWSLGKADHKMAHDGWVWLLATSTGKVATIRDALALYRQHGQNFVGAPTDWGVSKTVRVAKGSVNYEALAELEVRYSEILTELAGKLAVEKRAPVQRLSKQLARRGLMHGYRAELYAGDAGLLQRVKSFVSIALLGGYLPDEAKTRLGVKALVKDLVFGVPGLGKRAA